MSGSWGRKRPWIGGGVKGEEKEGEKGKRMNDSILMNNSMNIDRWIINIWIFIMDTLIPQS